MHHRNIIHRDIKPENILLESDKDGALNIKMTDFGFACFYNPEKGLTDVLGSPLYMAPEIVKEERYDEKVDIWSIGVITYILLSGRPPFKGRSKPDIFKSILNDEVVFTHQCWNNISKEAKNFITRCVKKRSADRPKAKDLLDDPWITGIESEDISLGAVKKRSADRPKAKDLLDDPWITGIESEDIASETKLEIAQNLKEFRDTTVFQSGVLQFLVSLKTTSEDLEELKKIFISLDTSKDGTLQMNELQEGMRKIVGVFKGDVSQYQDLMETLDKNGDGVIDYTEFITAAIDKAVLINKDNLLAAFQLIDKDNSGVITVDELKAAFDSHGEKDEELWREIMDEVDKNKDNEISLEEFMGSMSSLLKKKHHI
eukprot:CAMPEP_0202977988 /NCGR_PEP_ID=MMETSP1396-20130829/84578_1 /ASSEMBLY_ACC=CAM_ASM_000872 /TAXON_ID= /ORGANISM="Pseudokeronopsis sp., Strain Brazil" /LENGTH=371 /DNA_ID=CAMNT_0049716843 /DNA_START=500 /DNA_END=1614 /DNA_ORIENTATION=-